jgi:hypothetical protein
MVDGKIAVNDRLLDVVEAAVEWEMWARGHQYVDCELVGGRAADSEEMPSAIARDGRGGGRAERWDSLDGRWMGSRDEGATANA